MTITNNLKELFTVENSNSMGKSDSNRQYILLPQDCIHVWMQGDSFSFCFFFLKIHALNV